MLQAGSSDTLAGLEPGDHLCCLYETQDERCAILAAFIRQGLEGHEKVLLVMEAASDEKVLPDLRASGLEVEQYLNSGQLSLLSVEDAYMQAGVFEPDRMIATLQAQTDSASAEGYAALRVSGATAWAQPGRVDSERLIEYEARLSAFLSQSRCLALCQYDRRGFDPGLLLALLAVHSIAIIGAEVYDNAYPIPPAGLASDDLLEVLLSGYLDNLAARKLAERARREAEARYRSLVDSASDVIFTLSTGGIITSLNPAFETNTGWLRADWVGSPFATLVHPDDRLQAMQLVDGALQGETPPIFELRTLASSGAHMIGEFTVSPQIQGGQVIGLVGTLRNITRPGQARADRQVTQARLAGLLDLASDAIIMLDDDQRIRAFNQGAERIFDYQVEEVLGQPLDLLLPARLTEVHRQHVDAFAAGPETARRMAERQSVFGRRKDASEFPAEASVARLAEDGHNAHMVILRDITGRVRAEEALQRQAQIIDQIHDSVVSTDLEGHVTSWNKGAERLFGYAADEALGQHISFVYPADQHEFLRKGIIAPLKAKGTHAVEVQMRKKSGESFYAHLSLSLLRDSQDAVSGMIGYSMDISQQKRAEMELTARARQQAAVAELGQRALGGGDLSNLMDEAVASIAETLGVEYTKVLEILPDGEALLLRAGVGWREGYVDQARVSARTASQAGYTLLSTEPVIVEDLRAETRFSGPPLLAEHGVVSGVSVIIHGRERPFGILGAHTARRRRFSVDDIHFLQAVANVLAIAVERKRAEQHLAYQAHLLANVHDAILAVDERFTLTAWNRAAEEMYGWTAEEVLGRKVEEVIRSEFSSSQQAEALRTLAGSGHYRTEVVQYRKDGRSIYVEGTTIALKGQAGRITGYVSVNRDITERKQAEVTIRSLLRISKLLNSTLDLETLMDILVQEAIQLVEAEGGCAGLRTEEGMTCQYYFQGADKQPLEYHWPPGHGIPGWLMMNKISYITNDALEDEHIIPALRERFGVKAAISTPILDTQGDIIGFFEIHNKKDGSPFGQADREKLWGVSQAAAIAIQNALAYRKIRQADEALRRYARRLEVLRDLDRAILEAQSLEEIAQAALSRVRELVACRRASVVLFDLAVGESRLLAVQVDGEPQLGEGAHVPLELFGDLEVFQQGHINAVEDIQAIVRPAPVIDALRAEGIRSYINVPLVVEGELVGSLNLGSETPGAFAPESVKVAVEVAEPLAIAIQQARLFQSLSAAHERLQTLSRRLVAAEETERRRIAHELHDEIGQALTVIQINLQALQTQTDVATLAPHLEDSLASVERVLRQVRSLSLDLRPSLLDDLGLVATLRWYVDRQAQLGGLAAKFTADPGEVSLPQELETACFRVVQEALTNVLRHARAHHVRVELRQHGSELEMTIRDDGAGFDVRGAQARAAGGASLGLLGMQERVLLLGGQIGIQSTPGHGTEIRVRFPLSASSSRLLPGIGA